MAASRATKSGFAAEAQRKVMIIFFQAHKVYRSLSLQYVPILYIIALTCQLPVAFYCPCARASVNLPRAVYDCQEFAQK